MILRNHGLLVVGRDRPVGLQRAVPPGARLRGAGHGAVLQHQADLPAAGDPRRDLRQDAAATEDSRTATATSRGRRCCASSIGPILHTGIDRTGCWPILAAHHPASFIPGCSIPGAWQIAMIGLGTATAQLDTAVNIAFPAITRGFDLAIGDIQWVVICYVLAYASLLLALGRIGDTIGHAVVYRTGLVCSAVAFLLVGLCAELRRDAGVSLHAGHRRGAGAELRRGAGDKPLRRGTAQPGARHLHHDDGARADARSAARRRAGGDLGLAGGVLVPHSDRDRGAAAVARPAGVAAARGTRSASTFRAASRWCWAW